MLSYWYRPDTSQVAFNPQPIIFPVYSAREWAAGNKRTAATGSYIGKLVNRRLREKAFSVLTFLQNLQLLVVVSSFYHRCFLFHPCDNGSGLTLVLGWVEGTSNHLKQGWN